ncbi:helix-turn-helix domain-containing protein [Verrucosispora sioxanthis]|uniref:helix-turn-helix domain-containing protein n=1 Tax=Verrucosispora sioxanthis TaxID=2499994 RepID=UPI001C112FE7|nr:helix-turn-helix domain-containing protein [Verrucosispora sioxanthis]
MGDELPIGRRVAYWRGRRRMSQQVFADRLGKSKSWVDKVERGARSLDKVSTIAEIAAVLRVDQSVLLGHDVRPVADSERAGSVERIRAALAAYDIAVGRRVPDRDVPAAAQVARGVAYAWTTYQHARYPQLTDLLPELISGAQRGHARELASGRVPLVEAYRIGAALLTKLGETELAWLAADRAMTLATGDAVLVASAAVQLGEVLRATGRARGDERAAADLLDEAADLADRVGDGHDHHRTAFGPTAVTAARTVAALELGDAGEAVAWHQRAVRRDGWRWLPVEHRAAHLIDAARAHLHAHDPTSAARTLLQAQSTAPAEVRHRPAARDLLAEVLRSRHAPTTIVQLAAALKVPAT